MFILLCACQILENMVMDFDLPVAYYMKKKMIVTK